MGLLDVYANFPYLTIAPLVGLEPVANYTVAISCPFCGCRSFAIHQDSANLEELYFCSHCQANGSIIGLAAERLGMSEANAIRYFAKALEQEITHKSITAYCKACDLKNKYRKLWEHSKNRVLKPSLEELAYLKFLGWNLRSSMSFERKWEGPAELYGVADPYVAEKLLSRRVMKKQALVVLPFYRTPNVLSSFVLFSPKQVIATNNSYFRENVKGEPGFAGIQFLDRFNSDTVVATSLLKSLVQLQVQHFSSNLNPLPLVGWNQTTKPNLNKQWSIFDGRQLILWEKYPSAALLRQAIMCDANIVFQGPSFSKITNVAGKTADNKWKKWVRHVPAIDTWRKLVRNAKPVEHAVRNWARIATDTQKVQLLQDAEQYDKETADLVRSCMATSVSKSVGRSIKIGSNIRGNQQRCVSSYTVITEKNNKWYDRHGKLKLSGVVRVHKIVVHKSGKKEYLGTLYHEDSSIEFRVDKALATMPWLIEFALSHGVRLRSEFYADWYANSNIARFNPFEAAMEFEQPVMVLGKDKIGWDGVCFQFKSATLANGVFTKNKDALFCEEAPGPSQHFSSLQQDVKTAISRITVENEITWAIAISLCTQISAPAANLQPYGIVLKREIFDEFVRAIFSRFKIKQGSYTGWKHNWPRRLDDITKAAIQDDSGFFVGVSKKRKAPLKDTIEVELPEEELQPRLVSYSSDKILLNYLRWFSRKNHEGDWPTWLHYTKTNIRKAFPYVPAQLISRAYKRLTIR